MPNEHTDTKKRAKKPLIRQEIVVGDDNIDESALREVAMKEPEAFARKVQTEIEEGRFSWGNVRDLKHMYQNLHDIPIKIQITDPVGIKRAITTSAFPFLSSGLTIAGVNAAYQGVPTIGENLVTDQESDKKVTQYVTITSEDVNQDRREEGDPYPEIGAGEERAEIRHKPNGRRISITAEMIQENDIPNIVQRVNALGEIPAELIEEQTLRRVCDIDGSAASPAEPYVYHPEGTGTALYSSTAENPGARAGSGTRVESNALSDETDLENVRVVLANMLNTRGRRIFNPVSQMILLVPDALASTAWKILRSEYTPGVENEVSPWGPRGQYQPTLLSSPKLDDLSTTAWYVGNFRKQFVRKWKLRYEYVAMGMDTLDFLKNRIAFQARVAWDCEIGAIDYVWVVQSLSGTSAPTP